MLVVKCREGTSVTIGDHVRVCIGQVVNGQVRLDIDRPEDLPVRSVPEAALSQLLADDGGVWNPDRMFAVSPKAKPELMIGSDIRIAVLSASGDAIGLGISAPPSMAIARHEGAPATVDLSARSSTSLPHPKEPATAHGEARRR